MVNSSLILSHISKGVSSSLVSIMFGLISVIDTESSLMTSLLDTDEQPMQAVNRIRIKV